MSALDLDAIEARAAAATAGPWAADSCQGEAAVVAGGPVALMVPWRRDRGATIDCAFIAAARTDVPALVAIAREQVAQIATLRAAYDTDLAGLRAEVRRADDERAAWREIIGGRAAPPTDAEIIAHHAAGGSWLVGFGRTRETVDTMRTARAIRSHATRWWPLSREGCPCAWPVAEVTQ